MKSSFLDENYYWGKVPSHSRSFCVDLAHSLSFSLLLKYHSIKIISKCKPQYFKPRSTRTLVLFGIKDVNKLSKAFTGQISIIS